MATYPALCQSLESTRQALNDVKTDFADDGTPHAQSFYSVTQYLLAIHHPHLTTIEKESIEAFYSTNKALEFTFNRAADLKDYSVIFLGEPDYNKVAHNYWTVTMKAQGTLL